MKCLLQEASKQTRKLFKCFKTKDMDSVICITGKCDFTFVYVSLLDSTLFILYIKSLSSYILSFCANNLLFSLRRHPKSYIFLDHNKSEIEWI